MPYVRPGSTAFAVLTIALLARAGDDLPPGVKVRLGSTDLRTVSPDSVALSPDGKLAAYRASTDSVRVIDAKTRKEVRVVTVTEKELGTQMAFSGDGKRLVFFNFFGVTQLDAETGKRVGGFPDKLDQKYLRYGISADGSLGATAPTDSRTPVKLWDAKTGAPKGEIDPAQNGNISFALSGNGKVLATTGRHTPKDATAEKLQNVVEVWDTATLKRAHRIDLGEPATLLSLSADGKWLALFHTHNQYHVTVWEVATGKKAFTSDKKLGNWVGFCFAPDGKRVAVASEYGDVSVYDTADGKPVVASSVPARQVPVVALPTEGSVVAAAATGPVLFGASTQAVVTWTVPGDAPPVSGPHIGNVLLARFTADGKRLITVGSDDRVVGWDVETGKGEVLLDRFSDSHPPVYALSPDGKYFATKTRGSQRLVDLEKKKDVQMKLAQPVEREYMVWERLLFSADGKTLFALGNCDKTGQPPSDRSCWAVLNTWDAGTGKLGDVKRQSADRFYTRGVCEEMLKKYADVLPGGKKDTSTTPRATVTGSTRDPWLAKNSFGGTSAGLRVVVKAPNADKPIFDAETLAAHPEALAVSPDGKLLAVGANDTTVLVYDLTATRK
jgi:WD40 repeat protein